MCRLNLAVLLFCFAACIPEFIKAQENPLLKNINIESQKGSIYELLKKVTDVSGFYFIYDSKVVESDKRASISSKSHTLKQLLDEILDDELLDYKIIDKHILIYKLNWSIRYVCRQQFPFQGSGL